MHMLLQTVSVCLQLKVSNGIEHSSTDCYFLQLICSESK